MLRSPIPRSQKANSRPHPSLTMQQNTPACRYSRITDLLREKSGSSDTPIFLCLSSSRKRDLTASIYSRTSASGYPVKYDVHYRKKKKEKKNIYIYMKFTFVLKIVSCINPRILFGQMIYKYCYSGCRTSFTQKSSLLCGPVYRYTSLCCVKLLSNAPFNFLKCHFTLDKCKQL